MNWHSGKPTTEPVGANEIVDGEINYGEPNGARLHDYTRLDISALYNLKLKHRTDVNIGISIWNVLDKENIINNYYRIVDNKVSKVQQESLGFTPNVVLRVFFN